MTTEKPILFNGEMVRAILAGRKTQTRRMIIGKKTRQPIQMNISTEKFLSVFQSPYGKPGDTLWVRETFAPYEDCGAVWFRAGIPEYRAGRRVGWIDFPYRLDKFIAPPDDLKWTPSIFMPRWASRITLEVTAVRTEPLQDISEQDAIAEGVRPLFTYDEIHTPKYRAELDLDPMPYTTIFGTDISEKRLRGNSLINGSINFQVTKRPLAHFLACGNQSMQSAAIRGILTPGYG